jgi:two-component system, LytTR family, response regulator
MIRALVVDDEPLARRAVRAMLEAHRDFEVAGEAGHGAAAVESIAALRPDLVFLDVQMPGMNGFEVIDAVGPGAMPPTVFVTAFDAYAVRAFEVQALDYVLKPFDDLRFAAVLERARRRIAEATEPQEHRLRALLDSIGDTPKLIARGQGGARLVRLDEIDWIAAAGDYAEIHAGTRTVLVGESLASLEARLPKEAFARIHRSAIVRLDRLTEVRPGTHGDGMVRLACGAEVRFSRRYRQSIDAHLAR